MEISKRELIDLVRDAYAEGMADGVAKGRRVDEKEARLYFKYSYVADALRRVLGMLP